MAETNNKDVTEELEKDKVVEETVDTEETQAAEHRSGNQIAVQNALSKQFYHRIQRINLNYKNNPFRGNSLKRIYNGHHIKQEFCKNIPDIFNISEKYIKYC